uniref:Uncharacterized protein n=1 Tax=Sus scrofa TaxID=9823 RepID=A0A8D1R9V3_PIG
ELGLQDSQLRILLCGMGGWPGGPAGLAALKPKQLPQKQKTIPFFSGSCFSVLLLPLTWRCCRSNIGNGS